MLVKTAEVEAITPEQMMQIVEDWTGRCPNRPGLKSNTDVLLVLVDTRMKGKKAMGLGIEPHVLAEMARRLACVELSRYEIGKLICDLLGNSRSKAAIVQHARRFHGLTGEEAKRDLAELHAEAREMVQREVLATIGRRRGRAH